MEEDSCKSSKEFQRLAQKKFNLSTKINFAAGYAKENYCNPRTNVNLSKKIAHVTILLFKFFLLSQYRSLFLWIPPE